MTHNNQSGRSMTEMLGVLAIMGIITYGALSGINYGMTSYKVNQMYIEIGNIANNIQDMYLTVYGKNNIPDRCCDNTGNTPTDCNSKSGSCNGFTNNDILNKNLKGLKIKIENNQITITYTMPNTNSGKDICKRLKDMDWAVQSINVEEHCDSSPYMLTFTPK